MLIHTRHDPRFYDSRLYKGGGGSTTTTEGARTTTVNTDERMAVQDGIGTNGDGNTVNYSSNSSDAVVAMASMGAEVIKASGGAVVDLYKDAGANTTAMYNNTVETGAEIVDKLIDGMSAGFDLSSKAIDSFQPSENANNDVMKWAAIAAGVVGVAYVMKASK